MGYESLEGVKVTNYLLRYVIPFSYDDKTAEDSYTYAVQKLKEAGWTLEERSQAESECYDYLKTIYTMAEDDEENSNVVGSIWSMPWKKKEKVSICYQEEEIINGEKKQKKLLEGNISKAGIYLLKNKIGLFWYEVDLASEKYNITLDLLVEFQNRFKELASHGDGIQIKLSGEFEVDKEYILAENDNPTPHYKVVSFPKKDKKAKEEIKKKSYKIAKKALIDHVDFLKSEDEIGSSLLNAISYSKDGKEGLKLKYTITLATSKLGVWISRKLAALDCEISYYPNRNDGMEEIIPDKAILFNYVAVEEVKKERTAEGLKYAAYYLTKGYKRSYHPAKNFESEMKYPFENIIWNVQKEGCGLYISYDEENKVFLIDGMKDRVARDYFHLYMSLLQQSYILLKFSEEIATTISTDKDEYRYRGTQVGKKLEDLQLRINLFLMKNIYASVGFTSQHNQFYTYAEQALNIKEDIDALNSGVGVLDELLRRKEAEQRVLEKEEEEKRRRQEAEQKALEKEAEEEKSARMQMAFSVLTVLSVLSMPKTLSEFFGVDIVDYINLADSWSGILLTIFYVVTICLFAFVLKHTLPVLKKFKKSSK